MAGGKVALKKESRVKGSIDISARLITLLPHRQKLAEIVRLSSKEQRRSHLTNYFLAKDNPAFSGQRTITRRPGHGLSGLTTADPIKPSITWHQDSILRECCQLKRSPRCVEPVQLFARRSLKA